MKCKVQSAKCKVVDADVASENGLPKGWVWSTIGDAFSVTLGQSPDSDSYNTDKKGMPFFQGKAEFGEMYPTIEKWCTSPTKVAEEGAVLLSVRAPIGPTNINPIKSCIGRGLAAIAPHDGGDSKFILYLLRRYASALDAKGTGTTFRAITGQVLREFPIPLPPLDVQRQIVSKIEELFSDLDEGVESLKKAQEQLKVYRQSVLKAAFDGKLTVEWRAQQKNLPTAQELLATIQAERQGYYETKLKEWKTSTAKWEKGGKVGKKPSKPSAPEAMTPLSKDELKELPTLPEGWVYGLLSQTGTLARGKSKHRPRNDPSLFGGAYPFIQTGDVRAANGHITAFTETYSKKGLEQSMLWEKGTLCITIAANIAETAFLEIEACFPDSIVGFVSHGAVDSRFVEYFIRSAKAKISAYAPATAQKNINLSTLEALVLPFCSAEEQKELIEIISCRISQIEETETIIENVIQGSSSLRQSILKRAFEGKLV